MLRSLLIPLLLAAAGVHAAPVEVLSPYDRPLDPVVWGVPLAGGPIGAAVLLPQRALQDAEALGSRLHIDAEAAAYDGEDSQEAVEAALAWERSGGLTQRLPFLGERNDVLEVVAAGAAGELAESAAQAVAQAVRDGAGLFATTYGRPLPPALDALFAGAEETANAALALEGTAIETTPEWGRALVKPRLGTLGGVRLVHMAYPGPPPQNGAFLPPLTQPALAEHTDFDVYWSAAVRLIVWAAGRDPGVRIAGLSRIEPPAPDEAEAPVDLPRLQSEFGGPLPSQPILADGRPIDRFRLVLAEPAPEALTPAAQLRQPARRWRQMYPELEALPEGATKYLLPLSAGAGDYLLDLWLRDGRGRTVAWHTQPIRLLSYPAIARFDPERYEVAPDDVLGLRLAVDTPPYSQLPCRFVVRATDGHGRVVSRIEGPVREPGVAFGATIGFADLVSPLLRLEAFAFALPPGGQAPNPDLYPASWAQVTLAVRGLEPAAQPAVVAEIAAPFEPAQAAWWTRLRDSGVSHVLLPPPPDGQGRLAALEGLAPSYRIAQWTPDVILDDVVRVPSLADPAYREEQVALVQDRAAQAWGGASAWMLLGRGNCLAENEENVCQSVPSLERFREMLQRDYGTIDALNTAWQTAYAHFHEAVPAPQQAAEAFGVFPPWLDFRLAMDAQFTGMHVLGAAAVEEVRPGAAAGFVARRGAAPALGYDWASLSDGLGVCVAPPEICSLTRLRDFRRAAAHHGLWLGKEDLTRPHENQAKGQSGSRLGRLLSKLAYAGRDHDTADAHWHVWCGALHGAQGLWFDVGITEILRTQDAENGAAAAALEAAAELQEGLGYVLETAARSPKRVALLDSQASRYLSHAAKPALPTEAAQAAWRQLLSHAGYAWQWISPFDCTREGLDPFDAVVLPGVYALSEGAMAALQSYAQGGGILLADIECGLFDEHGAPRLDTLWDASKERGGEGPWRVTSLGDGQAMRLDPAALEGFLAYSEDPRTGLREALLDRLTAWGLSPLAHVEGVGGDPFGGLWMTGKVGPARLFAALAPPDEAVVWDLELPKQEDGHWAYDLRRGLEVFNTRDMEARMAPGEAAVYAVLPYGVEAIEAALPPGGVPGERLPFSVRIETTGGLPGSHPVRATLSYLGEVITPQVVQPKRCYARIIQAKNGVAESYFPLAFNDPPGRYRLEVRDLLSGAAAYADVPVAGVMPPDSSKD